MPIEIEVTKEVSDLFALRIYEHTITVTSTEAHVTISSRVRDHLMVKLTDFGLARDSMLATTAHMTTKAGTPGFMAPEILEEKPYDASVDVFALGLVFLALVNHKKGEEVLKPRIGSLSYAL